jgi:hypothetical protein
MLSILIINILTANLHGIVIDFSISTMYKLYITNMFEILNTFFYCTTDIVPLDHVEAAQRT